MAPNFDSNQAYPAKPGGRYSEGMLKLYMKKADSRDKQNLKLLSSAIREYPYMRKAYEASLAWIE